MRVHLILAAGITAGLSVAAGTAGAQSLPNCGGQNAAPHPVPYSCQIPGHDISATLPNGSTLTRHFSAVVRANGTSVEVDYTMSAPLPVAVPIRIEHHEGVSGAGGASDQSKGTIAAGATTATLSDSSPCRAGQLDVKAVYTAPGDSRGLVGGPWIENGSGCTDLTSTTPPTTAPPATPPLSPPPPSVSQGPPVTTPAPAGPPTSRAPLPATGSSVGGWAVGGLLGALSGGLLIVAAGRARPVER